MAIDPELPNTPQAIPRLPDGEEFRPGQSPLLEEISNRSDDPRKVQKSLQSFLEATSLEERKSFLTPESLSKPSTSSSILAGPIPPATSTFILNVLKDQEEQRTDFFYVVTWDGKNNSPVKPMTVELHQWPGSDPVQLQTEAFLQFYNKALFKYAAQLRDKPEKFFVIAECIPRCFETDLVNDHKTKATLKLGSYPNDPDPVNAYFDQTGDIMTKLKTYRNGLPLRKAVPLSIILNWSDEQANGKRYLELIKIESFDWHP